MIHVGAALLILALLCVGLFILYPIVTGEVFDESAAVGSIIAVAASAAFVGLIVRWRL